MIPRTVDDKLREEYFDLLPKIRRVKEQLEAEVRFKSPTTRRAGGLMKPPRRGRCCWESP